MNYIFDTELAVQYGLEESILLQNLIFWITKNEANNKHFHDGLYWTYNSTRAFSELFPFWTDKQIKRILESLITQGVVITGNYNKSAYDRTKWYSIIPNEFIKGLNRQMELLKQENALDQTGGPIPDSKPDSKPDGKDILSKDNINFNEVVLKGEDNMKQLDQLQKKVKRRCASKSNLTSLVGQFTTNELIRKALFDYLEVRQQQRHMPTIKSFTLMLNRLREFSMDDTITAIEIIENSTRAGYRDFYNLAGKKPATFDNIAQVKQEKPLNMMDNVEKRDFYRNELAKDKNGLLLEF